jgi:proteasome lid subunit RPN8/RPN11
MLYLKESTRKNIRNHGEKAYPNECCGLLLGTITDDKHDVSDILPIVNAREPGEQYHRFVITPEDFMQGELEAMKRSLDIIGIYHSHPDHPAVPSEYDREHALPFYSYIITSIEQGNSVDFTSWELSEDRTQFLQEEIICQ